MRKQKRILTFILMLCLMLTGILITSDTAYAGSITSISQEFRLISVDAVVIFLCKADDLPFGHFLQRQSPACIPAHNEQGKF